MFDDLKKIVDSPKLLIDIPDINSATDVISMVANIVLGVGFAFGFIGLAMSFVQLTISRGNPDASHKAINGIMWSVLAIVVTIMAFAIKYILLSMAGVTDQEFLNERPSM